MSIPKPNWTADGKSGHQEAQPQDTGSKGSGSRDAVSPQEVTWQLATKLGTALSALKRIRDGSDTGSWFHGQAATAIESIEEAAHNE